MTPEFTYATRLLNSVSDLNETYIELFFLLKSDLSFVKAHHDCDIRRSSVGCLLDFFVEVELNDSLAYCWWTKIRSTMNGWELTTSLLKTEDGDQEVLSRINEFEGRDIEEILLNLERMKQEIYHSVKQFIGQHRR